MDVIASYLTKDLHVSKETAAKIMVKFSQPECQEVLRELLYYLGTKKFPSNPVSINGFTAPFLYRKYPRVVATPFAAYNILADLILNPATMLKALKNGLIID